MDLDTYRTWAQKTWPDRPFVTRSVVPGQKVILTRLPSTGAQTRVKVYGDGWQVVLPTIVTDPEVASINWITFQIHVPLLIAVDRPGETLLRFLMLPIAPEGDTRALNTQTHFMVLTRVQEVADCNVTRARQLMRIQDPQALQLYWLAAFLFNRCDGKIGEAIAVLESLWGYPTAKIHPILPEHLRCLVDDNPQRRGNVKARLKQCMKLMATWRAED